MNKLNARSGRAGMVLFELIIALFVFTTAAFALVLALQTCFGAADNRNQIDVALRGLQNQMALLNGARITPSETDAPDDGSGVLYHVSVALDQTMHDQKGANLPNLYRATVTARWKQHGGDTASKSVSELIFQP